MKVQPIIDAIKRINASNGPTPAGDDCSPEASRARAEWLKAKAARVLAFWHSKDIQHPLLRSYFVLFLAGACLTRAFIGMQGLHIYTHDLFIPLDGAWRVLHGQRPYNDFFSDLGPAFYLAAALGLKLAHGSAAGLAWVQGLTGAALGLWAFLLASRRLLPVPRALFCAAVVLTAVAPYQPGESIIQTSPATTYNRVGYSLIALVMLEASLPREVADRSSDLTDGFSTGFIWGGLFFLKITYFLWIIPLLILLFPCRMQTRSRWAGVTVGFVCATLPFLVYLRGSLGPMMEDLRLVGGAKSIRLAWSVFEALHFSLAPMLLFIVAALVVMLSMNRPAQLVARAALIGVAGVIGGYLFLLTNNQGDAMPLNGIAAILTLQLVNAHSKPLGSWPYALVTLWGAWLILTPLCLDCGGLLCGLGSKMFSAGLPWTQLHAARLVGVGSLEPQYLNFVNDGIALLEKHRLPGDTVMCLDFSNPFSFALGLPPARGGASVLQFETNFDYTHHPAPEWLIGEAKLVMEPVVYSDGSLQDSVPRIYGPYLASHFHIAGESPQWKLYRENQ